VPEADDDADDRKDDELFHDCFSAAASRRMV